MWIYIVLQLVRAGAEFGDGEAAAVGELARRDGRTAELQEALAAALGHALSKGSVQLALSLSRTGAKFRDAAAAAVNELLVNKRLSAKWGC